MARITWADKTGKNPIVDRSKQITDLDLNETKASNNVLYDLVQDEPDAILKFLSFLATGDDAGVSCFNGQFSVGRSDQGFETCLGFGDSYAVPAAYHCTIANTTGQTITSAIDETTTFASDSGSSAALLNGTAVGNYLLIGSPDTFTGAKLKVLTGGLIEAGYVTGEYLTGEGGTWEPLGMMAVTADLPQIQLAREFARVSGRSEHIRFGTNPLESPITHEAATMNINGTDVTMKWARLRIVTAITTDPIIEQIKLNTDKMEFNAWGGQEAFGRARFIRSIPTRIYPNADKTPASYNIPIAPGMTVTRVGNRFANNKADGLIVQGQVPQGQDTSINALLFVPWFPLSASTDTVVLELETTSVTDDFVYDGTASKLVQPSVTVTLDNLANNKQVSIFVLDVQDLLPDQNVYGSLFRDATPGSTSGDDYAGDIVIDDPVLVGGFWK